MAIRIAKTHEDKGDESAFKIKQISGFCLCICGANFVHICTSSVVVQLIPSSVGGKDSASRLVVHNLQVTSSHRSGFYLKVLLESSIEKRVLFESVANSKSSQLTFVCLVTLLAHSIGKLLITGER